MGVRIRIPVDYEDTDVDFCNQIYSRITNFCQIVLSCSKKIAPKSHGTVLS